MGRARARHLPVLLALLVTPWLLSSCLTGFERRFTEELYSGGELHQSRKMWARLVAERGSIDDRQALADIDQELSTLHFERARLWIHRRFPQQAYHELALCLYFQPRQPTCGLSAL